MIFQRSIALLLLGLVSATAQEPVPAPPGVPVPGAQPGAAGEAGPQPANANLGDTKIVEDIIEPKLSGSALAGLYRKYTGRRVIVASAAAAAEFSFVQEASPQDPLTYAEAAELLRKAAVLEGFVFTEHPDDPRLDILTLASGAVRPNNVNVDVFNENSQLPDKDVVITYVMALNYLKPDQAVNIFTQVVGQFGAYGSISAVPNASAVVITEKASLIKSLIELQKTIDVPGSVQATRFIEVKYADVTEIAATLTELLTAQQSAQKTSGIQRADAAAPAAPPGVQTAPGAQTAGQSGGSGGGEETPVQIIPDPRTNRIFAMGRPVDLLFVEGLVREFDVETSEKSFLRRKLRFLTVSEFLPIAGDALTRAFSGTGDGGTSGASGGGQPPRQQGSARQTSTGTAGRGSRSTGTNGSSSGFGGASGGGSSGSAMSGSVLADPDVNTAPESMLVGRTLLVADNITNSIVVQGPPSGLEIIERLLDQLDVKADQVLISCVFGQLGIKDDWSFGMDYIHTLGLNNHFAGRGGSDGGGTGSGVPLSPSGTFSPGSLFAHSPPGGLGLYGLIGSNMNVYLDAKQSDSNFKVLSRPTIFTANNQKGSIISGTRIAVPTSSYAYSGSTSPSTNFEYQDVALKLEVIPLVNSKDEITLKINLTSDDVGDDRPVGTGENQYSIPDILNRELDTTVTVPNKQTVVLGGLITDKTTHGTSGIPILSSIPGIGALFGTKGKSGDKNELIVFIQPSIVNSDQTLNDAQIDMDRRYTISEAAHVFADGPGAVPTTDTIPQVQEKGGKATLMPAPAVSDGSTVKPSLRPAHRR